MMKFPQHFLWGSALSAYQAEGDNRHADWWLWEIEAGRERSGRACRHYEYFEQDFDLARQLSHQAHRFSIEWSRIEPHPGGFSEKELKHYLDVVLSLRERGIEPIVTLQHFTQPLWLARQGGWEERGSVDRFLAYCRFVVRALGRHVRYWVTLNEPTIYLSHAYLLGVWPPQVKSLFRAKQVEDHMLAAHLGAYRLIHDMYQESGLPAPMVGMSQFTQAFVPCTRSFRDRVAAGFRDRWYNFGFLHKLARRQAFDFIGLNYYSRQLVDLKGWGPRHWLADTCESNHHPVTKNSLGWDIYPEGIFDLLIKLKRYRRPVLITENGICTSDDLQRWEYIREHLKNVHRALEAGVNVIGYLYWSLLDNFEWDKGFSPRFGLIDINYDTFQRSIRDSAKKFAVVCRTGVLE